MSTPETAPTNTPSPSALLAAAAAAAPPAPMIDYKQLAKELFALQNQAPPPTQANGRPAKIDPTQHHGRPAHVWDPNTGGKPLFGFCIREYEGDDYAGYCDFYVFDALGGKPMLSIPPDCYTWV